MAKDILSKIDGLQVAVLGDPMLDIYIHGAVNRISPEAPVPVLDVESCEYRPGGAANVALNAAQLGATVQLFGIHGADAHGRLLSGILQKSKVSLLSASRRRGVTTITKTRVVASGQQIVRIDQGERSHGNGNHSNGFGIDVNTFREQLSSLAGWADVIILSDYAKGALNSNLAQFLQNFCATHKKVLSIGLKPKNKLQVTGADLITLNRSEALELAGNPISKNGFPAAEVCGRLYDIYRPKNLVITLSEQGMLISRNGKVGKIIPTYAQQVSDVSGAGDTVISALSLLLAAGATLEQAAHIANLAAGVVVAKAGTATASPKEIRQQASLQRMHGKMNIS